jgi:hypothetical protein
MILLDLMTNMDVNNKFLFVLTNLKNLDLKI